MLFLIPCHFVSSNPVIYDCVESIKKHHPNDDILVVDSASSDKSYKDNLSGSKVHWIDANNTNYVTGVIKYTETYSSDYYCILQDSTKVHKPLNKFFEKEVGCLRYFQGFWDNPKGMGWAENITNLINIPIPSQFLGIFGSMFFGTSKLFENYRNTGIFNHLSLEGKRTDCDMERVNGIILHHLGYRFEGNSIQGLMRGFFDAYDSSYVEKIHLLRQ
jgi:hypothetical protein